MSTISNLIFHNASHYVTSSFGKRSVIKTSAGTTSSTHRGVDYGTNGKKIAQYAVADGTILSCGTASDGAKFVWVNYPSLGVKMLHYHLDTISVKSGQKVTKSTKLGTTGMTGKATGVHLHLGLKKIGSDTYIDPETWSKNVYDKMKTTSTTATKTTTTAKYTKGDYTVNVETDSVLRVRKGAGTNYAYLKFKELTANAQAQIKKLNNNKEADGLVKGCTCTVSEVNGAWGKIPSGWICLDLCKKTK